MTRASAPLTGNDRRAEPGTPHINNHPPRAAGFTPNSRGVPLFDLGRAARLNTDPAMFEYFGEARQLAEDPALRGNAAFELATALGLKGEWERAMSLLEEALEELRRSRSWSSRLVWSATAPRSPSLTPRLVTAFDRRLPVLRELVDRGGGAGRFVGAAAGGKRGVACGR